MLTYTRNWLLVGLVGLLIACGGGGGGNSAPGVEPGPPPPGGSVPPPEPEFPNPSPYAEAEELLATITDVTLNEDDQAVVQFQLTDGKGTAITDLTSADLRFVISKLETTSPPGNLTGTWQAYINVIEPPEYGTGTVDELQANYERDDDNHPFGELANNGDGTYTYQFATSLTNLPQDILDQAETQGLNLDYKSNLTHRVAIQFDGNDAGGWANPSYDWVPQTGATDGIFTMDIAATENCNRCHDPLGVHGGGIGPRREIKYCVTCHNAGTTDPDSTNTVDMKVMIHKIHRGANLPSVQEGGEYAIFGFGGSKHDYSNLHYPQDIRNCVNCHVGTGTVGDRTDLVLTAQGDNWAEYPTRASCGSCHDDVDFDTHKDGQPDDSRCSQCHSPSSGIGAQNAHRILTEEVRATIEAKVEAVTNTGPGQTPLATFRIFNPETGEDYDIRNDPLWANSEASLSVKFGWSTTDYTNTGNGSDSASTISSDVFDEAIENGDGSYRISAPQAIPDRSIAPGIPATGSGIAVLEGRAAIETDEEDVFERVLMTSAHAFYSIDESDGSAQPRRQAVELTNCLACHSTLSLHGSNRTDNIDSCVSCHNPRFYSTRNNRSVDFKVLIHELHGREDVNYPGDLSNCVACHTEDGYKLPLASTVLGTSTDLGSDLQDPTDDTVTTPATAVCSSCHTDSVAAAHMTSNGGSFDTSQGAIDSGEVIEECSVCHGEGRSADVARVHGIE